MPRKTPKAVVRKAKVPAPRLPRDIDKNIVRLVKVLNQFPEVRTTGSCGGHAKRTNASQWKEGDFYVKLTLPKTQAGWKSLEWLAWVINHEHRPATNGRVWMIPDACAPYMNPQGSLAFCIEGIQANPDDLAAWLERIYAEFVK